MEMARNMAQENLASTLRRRIKPDKIIRDLFTEHVRNTKALKYERHRKPSIGRGKVKKS